MTSKTTTIDEYIASFPEEIQEKLQSIRATVRQAAPDAIETISYGLPAFKLNGKALVYFGGWKSHIALYPTPSGTSTFESELSDYEQTKGSVHFPLDQPIPHELITRIVKFRAHEVANDASY